MSPVVLLAVLLGGPSVQVDTGHAPTVVIVRHAEKASATAADPPLSELGRARAAALDSALIDAGVTAIIVTQYQRTLETAAAVAARHHLSPIRVNVDAKDLDAHVQAVVKEVRLHDGVVLVVGHSNTVARIVRALGGPNLPDLCDANYATMFTVATQGGIARMIRSRFGAAEPAATEQCAAMIPH
jgi:broad specificity phosphatase PhoE